MKRLIAAIGLAVLLSGCPSLGSRARPGMVAPPPGGLASQAPESTLPAGETNRDEAAPVRPGITGRWESTSVSGPASASVQSVQMLFEASGAFTATMLIQAEGRKRFASLSGTWVIEEKELTITLIDGRTRRWTVAWDGEALLLSDGEATVRLERRAE